MALDCVIARQLPSLSSASSHHRTAPGISSSPAVGNTGISEAALVSPRPNHATMLQARSGVYPIPRAWRPTGGNRTSCAQQFAATDHVRLPSTGKDGRLLSSFWQPNGTSPPAFLHHDFLQTVNGGVMSERGFDSKKQRRQLAVMANLPVEKTMGRVTNGAAHLHSTRVSPPHEWPTLLPAVAADDAETDAARRDMARREHLPAFAPPKEYLSEVLEAEVVEAVRVEVEVSGDAREDTGGGAMKEVKEGDLQQVLASLEERFAAEPGAVLDVIEANARVLLAMGARRGQVLRLFRSQPVLAGRHIGTVAANMAELLASFRVGPPALLKAMSQSVDWLNAPPSRVAEVLGFLDRDLGVNNLSRVISISPHVLSQPLPALADTAAFLRTELQLGAEVGSALERNPALFGAGGTSISGRADVAAKLEVLCGLLHLSSSTDVLPLVAHFPPLLLTSAESARETYRELEALLGDDGAAVVVSARPQVLALPPGAIKEPVAQLVRRFGSQEAAAAVIASASASLLRRKWEKTAGKLEYVTGVMGRELAQVAAWPAVLSCNLQGRIKRRYEVLRSVGRGTTEPLRAMFGCSDRVFERRFRLVLPIPAKGKRGRKPKSDISQ